MTPLCTSGVDVFGPGGSDNDHASCSVPTLRLLIFDNGEKPSPSRVRRQLSQSSGEGFVSISSVTGEPAPSRLAASGALGSGMPGVSPPLGVWARKRCCSVSCGAATGDPCSCAVDFDGSAASAAKIATAGTRTPRRDTTRSIPIAPPATAFYFIGSKG